MKGGKNALYDDLKRQILTMELDPDQDLDEVSLSEQYGLSRTPVREIFRRLEGEGYIDIRANRGARVSPMNHQTLRHFFLVAPMISWKRLFSSTIERASPETLAARNRSCVSLRSPSCFGLKFCTARRPIAA